MKKNHLVLFLVLPLLGGCQSQDNKALIERKENPQAQIQLDAKSLTEKIALEHSFILQIADPSCRCSIDFSTILETIMQEKEIMIYKIYGSEFLNSPISNEVQYYSTGLAIFSKGKASVSIDAFGKWTHEIENPRDTNSKKPIIKFINKYCYLNSPFYALDKEEVLNKINNKDDFKIFYHRSGCSDCKYFNNHFLDEWSLKEENANYKLYSFDLQPYYASANASEEEQLAYQKLKDDLGLSVQGNQNFGYKTGVVPSLQAYKQGSVVDMAVFYNEDMEINEETGAIKIIDDYYHHFNNTEYASYDLYREATSEFYISKFLEIITKEY